MGSCVKQAVGGCQCGGGGNPGSPCSPCNLPNTGTMVFSWSGGGGTTPTFTGQWTSPIVTIGGVSGQLFLGCDVSGNLYYEFVQNTPFAFCIFVLQGDSTCSPFHIHAKPSGGTGTLCGLMPSDFYADWTP